MDIIIMGVVIFVVFMVLGLVGFAGYFAALIELTIKFSPALRKIFKTNKGN